MSINTPIRLIAMDMDGTLLLPHTTPGPRISDNCLRALREADRAGIHLAIASGRMPDDASFFARDMGLPMHILSLNGGCIQMEPLGEITDSFPMRPETAARLWQTAKRPGLILGMFAGHELTISIPLQDENLFWWGTHLMRQGSRCRLHGNGEAAEKLTEKGVHKLVVQAENDAALGTLAALRTELLQTMPEVEITSSWYSNIEINPKGCNKGSALCALAERLHIPMTEVMAIGDNGNDVPMLTAVGYGVAMGNATETAIASSGWQTLSNEQDGVAIAIRELVLKMGNGQVKRL